MRIVCIRLEVRHAQEGIDSYSKADSEAMGLPADLEAASKLLLELQAQYKKDLGEFLDIAQAQYRNASPEERKRLDVQFPAFNFGTATDETKESK